MLPLQITRKIVQIHLNNQRYQDFDSNNLVTQYTDLQRKYKKLKIFQLLLSFNWSRVIYTYICRGPDPNHAQFRTGPAQNEILIWPGPDQNFDLGQPSLELGRPRMKF